jgi:hypothetical protein
MKYLLRVLHRAFKTSSRVLFLLMKILVGKGCYLYEGFVEVADVSHLVPFP